MLPSVSEQTRKQAKTQTTNTIKGIFQWLMMYQTR
jgi:hypothetical protein